MLEPGIVHGAAFLWKVLGRQKQLTGDGRYQEKTWRHCPSSGKMQVICR